MIKSKITRLIDEPLYKRSKVLAERHQSAFDNLQKATKGRSSARQVSAWKRYRNANDLFNKNSIALKNLIRRKY